MSILGFPANTQRMIYMKPSSGVPVSPYTGVPGWESDAEEDLLSFYASQVPEKGRIVELGAEYGRSSAAFLSNSSETVDLISVDLFPTNHPVVGDLKDVYEANLHEVGFFVSDRFTPWRSSSHDAAFEASHWESEIDLLFIDADHSYLAVKQDIEDWTPKVKSNGVVMFHDVAVGPDSHPLHFDVLKAIEDALPKDLWRLEDQKDSLRAYRRV